MTLLDLVRQTAKRRRTPAWIRAALPAGADWRAAEQTLAGEIAAQPRRGARLVRAFRDVARAAGTAEALGRAARLCGSHLTYLARYRESRVAYREAIRRLTGAARDGARIGLAAAETRLGRFDAARALCRAARRDALRRGDRLLAAGADLNEAMALHESGTPRAALALYGRARDGFTAAGNARLAARATMDLANALVLLDRFSEAAPRFDEAARAFAAAGDVRNGALCRYNAGALAVAMDRLGDADLALAAAEREFTAAGDTLHAALARVDRGEAMLRAGLHPEARTLLTSALRSLDAAPPVERVRAAHLAARAAIACGDTAAAIRVVGASMVRGVKGCDGDRAELAARALASDGREGEASARFEEAARRFGRARPASRARALAAASWCARTWGDLDRASRLAAAAAKAAAPIGLPSLDFAAAAVEFGAARASGRRDAAGASLVRALDALERVRAGLGSDAFRAALLSGRETWFAEAVAHALEDDDSGASALRVVERFKARALLDLVGASDAAATGVGGGAAELRAKVAALERRAEGAHGPALLRSLAVPPSPALAAAERALAAASAASLRPGARDAADVGAVLRALPRDALVVSLWSDARRTVAFLAGADGERTVTTPLGAAEVAGLAASLRYTVGKSVFGEEYARRHAARLCAEADAHLAALAVPLAALADDLGRARHLVIVPHGAWHGVPFAALPIGGARLAEIAAPALAPAIGALAADIPVPSGAPLVLARADAAAPDIDAEAAAVAAALPFARVCRGDDATFAALAASQSPAVVHVAAHGRFRPDAPGMGGVLLADGWLRAVDFAEIRLPGALVVLSGCETGAAALGPGDEIHGLVRGVFASGAAELVASLWRVPDAATASRMASFHAHRARGATAPLALALAQREAIAAGLPLASWAAFGAWSRRRPVA